LKEVIFVGGTSYSGSTFLDMILANDPKGFSCGEVYALFHPFRPHHIHPICGCGDENCRIWSHILKNGEKHLYNTIFDMFPHIEFIVDSSKNPFWIKQQTKNIEGKGIRITNLLIYKTPIELASSFYKRNRLEYWGKSFVNYHKLYFTLINNWISLGYNKLVKDISTLRELCNYLGIKYFKGKEKYWTKKHHTLFGNTSAKIHLYSENEISFRKGLEELSNKTVSDKHTVLNNYRKIYYTINSKIEAFVNKNINRDKNIKLILDCLIKNDITAKKREKTLCPDELRYSEPSILLRKLKQNLIYKTFELKNQLK